MHPLKTYFDQNLPLSLQIAYSAFLYFKTAYFIIYGGIVLRAKYTKAFIRGEC
jgi:hypothetical protein